MCSEYQELESHPALGFNPEPDEKPYRAPIAIALYRWYHTAHQYMSSQPDGPKGREFDLRCMAYVIVDYFEDGTLKITYCHQGCFGELGRWYRTEPHGTGKADLQEDGRINLRRLEFSWFGGQRGSRFHKLKVAPQDTYRDKPRYFLAIHCGRGHHGQRDHIPSNMPWANMHECTVGSMTRKEREDLIIWARNLPVLPERKRQLLNVNPDDA